MYDLVLVGAGTSSYSFLKGLENNHYSKNKKIAIIYPSEYVQKTIPLNIRDISPKFLQQNNLLSLSYYINSFGKNILNNFIHIGVHGIGGMARIWGGSLATFDDETLIKNNININDFALSSKELENELPCTGNVQDGLEFFFNLKHSKSVKISDRIKNILGNYCNDKLNIGFPRLLVKDNCNSCNQCLVGCEINSVWYPMEDDFQNIKNIDLTIIKNSFVEKIENHRIVFVDKNNEKKIIESKKIVLGAGVFQNYKLLSQLDITEKDANLYITPAIFFAFFNMKRNKDKEFFGMGNATFIMKNSKNKINFFGNMYDGDSLSISKGLVFSKFFIKDFIFKKLAKYIIAGAGFMSSDNSKCTIINRNNSISINGTFSDFYYENSASIIKNLKLLTKEISSFLIQVKRTKPGADIHYAGGIPNELYDKNLIANGKLRNIDNIFVIGGSTFSYLAPESPTYSFMVNSYRIAKNFNFDN